MDYESSMCRIQNLTSFIAVLSPEAFTYFCALHRLINKKGAEDNAIGRLLMDISRMTGFDRTSSNDFSMDNILYKMQLCGIITRIDKNHGWKLNDFEVEFIDNVMWQIPERYWGKLNAMIENLQKPLSEILRGKSLNDSIELISNFKL